MDFTHQQRIACPPGAVFAFVADAENNPRWQNGMQRCTWTSAEKLVVGSTYEQHASFLGRAIVSTFVVTDFQPGRSISIETTESTFPIQVTRSVAPQDAGCVVTAHIRGQPGFPMRLMSWMVPRSVRADYQRLAALLEG